MSENPTVSRSAGRAFISEIEASPERRTYSGVDRRREIRRQNKDRRVEVRFDLKGDRREGFGRRADDASVKLW